MFGAAQSNKTKTLLSNLEQAYFFLVWLSSPSFAVFIFFAISRKRNAFNLREFLIFSIDTQEVLF